MKGSSEYRPHTVSGRAGRVGPSTRGSQQLTLQGFEGKREPAPPTAVDRGDSGHRRRSRRRSRRSLTACTEPAAAREPGLLSVVEKMELLIEHPHLLRMGERAWVERIKLSTGASAHGRYLSDRQAEVITDIFDRFRSRLDR